MTLKELLACVKISGVPVEQCQPSRKAWVSAEELIEYLSAAYQCGREATQSELAMAIVSNPIECGEST